MGDGTVGKEFWGDPRTVILPQLQDPQIVRTRMASQELATLLKIRRAFFPQRKRAA